MLWALSWTVVLLASRTASAVAPICDERGASAIAPPPVLQARDVKIDSGYPIGCDAPIFSMAALAHRFHAGAQHVARDGGFDDAWVRPAVVPLPKLGTGDLSLSFTALLPPSPGFCSGVFRPPRG
jgi:hypothetical protein